MLSDTYTTTAMSFLIFHHHKMIFSPPNKAMILKSGPLPNTTHECPSRGVMGEGRATYKRRWNMNKEDMMYTCRSVMSPLQMMNKTRHDITSQCNNMYMPLFEESIPMPYLTPSSTCYV